MPTCASKTAPVNAITVLNGLILRREQGTDAAFCLFLNFETFACLHLTANPGWLEDTT